MNKAKYIALTIIAFTGILILTVTVARMLRHREAHIEVSRDLYPVKGIDISSHNGAIDFAKVVSDTVDFVPARARTSATRCFTETTQVLAATGLQ